MAEEHSAKIRIRLLDKDDAPVADTGVTVSVEGSSAESVTDTEGRASFPKARVPSQIGIAIDIPGREIFETSVLYDQADEERVIRLPFQIDRKGILCAKVEDSSGNALKNISICLEIEDIKFDDVTDDEGKSVFSDIPIGKHGKLSVRCQSGETVENRILLKSSEETVTVVSKTPEKKSLKKYWVGAGLVVVLVVGAGVWLAFRSESTDSEGLPATQKDRLAPASENCQCEEEIEELRREIQRIKNELAEISKQAGE